MGGGAGVWGGFGGGGGGCRILSDSFRCIRKSKEGEGLRVNRCGYDSDIGIVGNGHTIGPRLRSDGLLLQLFYQAVVETESVQALVYLIWSRLHSPDIVGGKCTWEEIMSSRSLTVHLEVCLSENAMGMVSTHSCSIFKVAITKMHPDEMHNR